MKATTTPIYLSPKTLSEYLPNFTNLYTEAGKNPNHPLYDMVSNFEKVAPKEYLTKRFFGEDDSEYKRSMAINWLNAIGLAFGYYNFEKELEIMNDHRVDGYKFTGNLFGFAFSARVYGKVSNVNSATVEINGETFATIPYDWMDIGQGAVVKSLYPLLKDRYGITDEHYRLQMLTIWIRDILDDTFGYEFFRYSSERLDATDEYMVRRFEIAGLGNEILNFRIQDHPKRFPKGDISNRDESDALANWNMETISNLLDIKIQPSKYWPQYGDKLESFEQLGNNRNAWTNASLDVMIKKMRYVFGRFLNEIYFTASDDEILKTVASIVRLGYFIPSLSMSKYADKMEIALLEAVKSSMNYRKLCVPGSSDAGALFSLYIHNFTNASENYVSDALHAAMRTCSYAGRAPEHHSDIVKFAPLVDELPRYASQHSIFFNAMTYKAKKRFEELMVKTFGASDPKGVAEKAKKMVLSIAQTNAVNNHISKDDFDFLGGLMGKTIKIERYDVIAGSGDIALYINGRTVLIKSNGKGITVSSNYRPNVNTEPDRTVFNGGMKLSSINFSKDRIGIDFSATKFYIQVDGFIPTT